MSDGTTRLRRFIKLFLDIYILTSSETTEKALGLRVKEENPKNLFSAISTLCRALSVERLNWNFNGIKSIL